MVHNNDSFILYPYGSTSYCRLKFFWGGQNRGIANYPWFDLYDEGQGDVAPLSVWAGVKSVVKKNGVAWVSGAAEQKPHYDPCRKPEAAEDADWGINCAALYLTSGLILATIRRHGES